MTEPRDLHCTRCDARVELRHYDYPQHVRDHIPVVEAVAGPRDSTQPHGLSGLFYHAPGAPCVVCDREAAAGLPVRDVPGAAGDGVTDDTAAVRAAMTDWRAEYHRLLTACVDEGHVPSGTWPVTDTIRVRGD